MEYTWSDEVDSILCVGRNLDDLGVRNWALEREAALEALDKLSAMNVAVLGGDVYAASDADLEMNYDSWYCNQEDNEADADFVARSIAQAKSYIAEYRSGMGRVLFAIVPRVASE